MDTACTDEMYEQAKTQLENGPHSANRRAYSFLMNDPDGVIDSLLLTFEDTYGTVQERTTTRLYTKYEEQVHAGDPELNPTSYGHALAALDDMGLIEHDTARDRRWHLENTDPENLKAVKKAVHDPDIQHLYD